MNHKRWNLLPPLPEGHSLTASGLSPLLTQLLHNRGIKEVAQAKSFLNIDRALSPDPFLLTDMELAVNRVYRALLGAEKVAIYGDFDADGITATALLVHGLTGLGINTICYIPHRLNEGHGLKIAALEYLESEGVSLVITVDCGITGATQVKKANRMGMDVIITDHHTPTEELPPAIAVVNPKHPASNYPFRDLAGVGVAYKLLEALYRGLGKDPALLEEVTDLVALGTVADMTPLLGENRYLVNQGLLQLNKCLRPGLRELLIKAGMTAGTLSTNNITWLIAPRINTASRLDNALPSYELLTTLSPTRALDLAQWLEQKNLERQQITTRATDNARQQVITGGLKPILIVEDTDYPAGVSGLVAGRLVEEFYRPAVVIRTGKRVTTGSCRSIPEFNIVQALNLCRDLFVEYGGHAAAAGFMLSTDNVPQLQERLLKIAGDQLVGVDLRPRINIDAEVNACDLNTEVYKQIQTLEPFGQGNPQPTFLSRGVKVVTCRTMGNTSDHLRLRFEQGNVAWEAVAFGCGANIREITSPMDIVYNLELDQWNGRSNLRLNIIDFGKSN